MSFQTCIYETKINVLKLLSIGAKTTLDFFFLTFFVLQKNFTQVWTEMKVSKSCRFSFVGELLCVYMF